jgi:hypothetical protein
MEAKVLSNANRSASQSWQGSVMAELVRAEIASTGAAVQVRCRMWVGGIGLAQSERSSSRPWNMKASSAAQDSK